VVDAADVELRNATYAWFVELGRAPSSAETAERVRSEPAAVRGGWRRLHEAHALVLDDAGELHMANPFSAVPTRHRVRAAGRSWWANCAWDAFGICAALHVDGCVESSCPDCGEAFAVEVRDGRPDDESLVFHCLVPAARWWEDIVFT